MATPGTGDASPFAQALASVWTRGADDASEVRSVLEETFDAVLKRLNSVTGGRSNESFSKVGARLRDKVPAPLAKAQEKSFASETQATSAQQLSSVVFAMLEPQYRSLDDLLSYVMTPTFGSAGKPGTSKAPADAGRPRTDNLKPTLSTGFAAMRNAMHSFPTRADLGDRVGEILEKLIGSNCGTLDALKFRTQVPWQMASSYWVATQLAKAFKRAAAASSGLLQSDTTRGAVVHAEVAMKCAFTLMLVHQDRYLVAEDAVYDLAHGTLTTVETKSRLNLLTQQEHSLVVLQDSRNATDPEYIRRGGATSSREDLIVFFGPQAPTTYSGIFQNGRPELYEIKPVGSAYLAVKQITAYLSNYLFAASTYKCKGLRRLDNPLMLPASPEQHSLYFPVLTLTEAASTGMSLPNVEKELKKWAINVVNAWVPVDGDLVAVPFMISGLYGVVPYFLINTKKVKANVKDVLSEFAMAIVAVLARYVIKRLGERSPGEQPGTAPTPAPLPPIPIPAPAFERLLGYLLKAMVGIIVILALVVAFATPPGRVILAGALAVIVLFIIFDASPDEQRQPNGPVMTMYLGPLVIQNTTLDQIAQLCAQASNYVDDFFQEGVLGLSPAAVA